MTHQDHFRFFLARPGGEAFALLGGPHRGHFAEHALPPPVARGKELVHLIASSDTVMLGVIALRVIESTLPMDTTR